MISVVGTHCEVNIDDCVTSPCENGGTCVDGVDMFTCNCTDDRMGHTCSEVYNACSFTPCLNGATCTTESPSRDYSCACVSGFTDANCDVNIDDCVNHTCADYELCEDGVNDYSCACPPGKIHTTAAHARRVR